MGFLIKYENGQLEEEHETYNCVPYKIYKCEMNDIIYYGIGDFFNFGFKELVEKDWEKNPCVLDKIDGSISFVKIERNKCVFVVDRKGIDTLYYYSNESMFLISDNFWSIVKYIRPQFEDINVSYIRQSLLAYEIILGETIIKGLKLVHPASIGTYDAQTNELNIKQYVEFRYSNEIKSIDEAIENMDKILHRTMQLIRDNCEDVRYGVGISGGLDSRIISHYALEHDMKLVGFNTCIPKPHHFILSRSVSNAHKIADRFKISYKDVIWKPNNIHSKLELEAQQSPFFTGDAFKYETDGMPEIDVLLTGGTGLLVGSMLPNDIDIMDEEKLIDAMYELIGLTGKTTFINRVKRVLNYLFKMKIKETSSPFTIFTRRFTKNDDFTAIKNRIKTFVHDRKEKNHSNIDIFEEYFYYCVGFMNRFGAFESMMGTKRAFSVYTPFMFNETLRWSSDLLKNREVLNELIVKKIPEVADIKSESFYTSPDKKNVGFVKKALTLIEFLIRGNGTAIDQYYLRKRSVKFQFLEDINSDDTSWFKKIFDITNDITRKELKGQSERFVARIWSLKTLVDYLEKHKYEELS